MRATSPAAPRLATWIATWFGCGLSPKAPGTVGSIGAVPLHLLLSQLPWPAHALAVVVVALGGIWASQVYASARGEKDPQTVVIDEVAGTVIAMGVVRGAPWFVQLAGLIAFRVFDIWKPGPIRRVERVQPVGAGIMCDDLVAGVFAAVLVWGGWRLLGG
ncbi:MAG TPA: phosphatidylglycerophosphatase A [Polyangiaceae bacterium]|nr:phosphatidylglycerophosphatase A [Polyangiaceae bacterium]